MDPASSLCGYRCAVDLHRPELDLSQSLSWFASGSRPEAGRLPADRKQPSFCGVLGRLHHRLDDLDRGYLVVPAPELGSDTSDAAAVVGRSHSSYSVWLAMPRLVHNLPVAGFRYQPDRGRSE